MSLYTSFVLFVQNHSLPSFSPENMNGRHFALPSRPTVARCLRGVGLQKLDDVFHDEYLLYDFRSERLRVPFAVDI